MKTSYLLYEVVDKKKNTLKFIAEYPAKTYAKNEILNHPGKLFEIKKVVSV